ncbi:MAG: hypothetical protein ACOC1X_00175 [Promethearchaeota archaeon]
MKLEKRKEKLQKDLDHLYRLIQKYEENLSHEEKIELRKYVFNSLLERYLLWKDLEKSNDKLKKQSLTHIYSTIKSRIIKQGYEPRIEEIKNIDPKDISKEKFFEEYVWVVCNSGLKNQIAEKIFNNFWKNKDFNAINHPKKQEAIKEVYSKLDSYYKQYRISENKVKFLKSLPFIGDVTKYHLARNIGLNFAKPDRHMVKIAQFFGFHDVQTFCENVSKYTEDEINVIDYVFWRFANLNPIYLEILEKIIKEFQTE